MTRALGNISSGADSLQPSRIGKLVFVRPVEAFTAQIKIAVGVSFLLCLPVLLYQAWAFVGAGLRLSAELLGPEYSMSWNTLDSGLKLFFSREVKGKVGEDLVEKQNAEMGLMPVVANEAAAYGYEAEDRHFCRVFLGKETPRLTFDDGLDVVRLLMTAYQSAELGKTLPFPPRGIEKFVPAVARGEWKPALHR